ncbi:MAG: 3'-5' exonuclease [Leptospiraceae bacterium]|nr:3'-5' exonuclease [Leptospiraceae bacterium]
MNQSLLRNIEFTALDLETSGLDPNENEILEIAAIRFDRDKILNTYNFLVKPNKPIQPNAQIINGITPKMLENARSLDVILPEFLRFIDGSALVIQNSEFDLSFLLPEAKKRRLSIPTLPVFCTLNMTRKFFPELKKHNLVALRDYFKIEKMNTTSSRHCFHEALDDSFAAMKVFICCIDKIDGWEQEIDKANFHKKGYQLTTDYIRQDWLF